LIARIIQQLFTLDSVEKSGKCLHSIHTPFFSGRIFINNEISHIICFCYEFIMKLYIHTFSRFKKFRFHDQMGGKIGGNRLNAILELLLSTFQRKLQITNQASPHFTNLLHKSSKQLFTNPPNNPFSSNTILFSAFISTRKAAERKPLCVDILSVFQLFSSTSLIFVTVCAQTTVKTKLNVLYFITHSQAQRTFFMISIHATPIQNKNFPNSFMVHTHTSEEGENENGI
jgi:hypothetical protein